ncbi:TetR/AcrR family transcriptional regulator [Streptomyces avicenniae]|uniref:TetR/AcrR family transcriptional regulator n=1 Tax=Streptomyces avicenniae TaxID=500153 RepID=UPI00069BFAB5|nr:TetR/AcrR family transcriptional regulator [Streptomyces avicenniae]
MGSTTATGTRLRADAVRNRERILTAAREAFVLYGADARLDEIARRAGVGNATLYRHFPDRDALLIAVVLDVNHRIIDDARRALEDDSDPFEALHGLVLSAAGERVGGLCPMLGGGAALYAPDLAESSARMHETVQRLVDRAHASGQLRPDVDSGDILVAVGRLTSPVPGTCEDDAVLIRRHLQIFLDGLRAPAPGVLPGEARSLADLKDEICRTTRRR